MVRCLDEKSRRTAKSNEPDTQLARGGYTFPRQRNQLRKIYQRVGTENRRLGKITKVCFKLLNVHLTVANYFLKRVITACCLQQ